MHPDGKWCVGTFMTTIVLTDLLGRIMLDDAVAEARDSKADHGAALDLAPPSPPVPGVWGTLQLRSFAFIVSCSP
jgi:hypothetical protein